MVKPNTGQPVLGSLFHCRIAVWLVVCMLCAAPAFSAVTVEVSVSKNVLRINETSRMQVTVRSDGNDALNSPTLPEINGLTFSFRGTSNKTNWSMVNGRTSVERAAVHEYDVIALAAGQYSLKDIRVQTENGFVAPKPVSITVLDQSAPAPTPTKQPVPTVENQTWPYYLGQLNKQNPYVGEETILDYYLLVPREFERSISIDKIIDKQGQFQSFWVEKDEIGRDLEKEYVKIENQIFAKFTITRYILYPLKPGKIEISPLEVQGRRAISTGISVFRRQENFTKQSNLVTLNVKPLPEESKPEGFKGAVGRFQLNSTADEIELDEGDPVTLSITLEGFGNLRNAPSPILPDLTNFDQFDPTTSQEIKVSRSGVSGRVEYTHVLIPHDINANEIGPVKYAYFDPEAEAYVTLETPPIELDITAALGGLRNGSASSSPRRIPIRIGDDFRYIHTSMLGLASINLVPHRSVVFWLFGLLPLIVLGATGYAKLRRDYLLANPEAAKRLKAPLAARACLSQAQEAISQGDLQTTYAAIGRAIHQTVDHCWNLAAAGLTINELKQALIEKGVDTDSIEQTVLILETVDGARFSGGSLDAQSAQFDLNKTEQIVQALMKLKSIKRFRLFSFVLTVVFAAVSTPAQGAQPLGYPDGASEAEIFSQANEFYRNNDIDNAIAGYLYLTKNGNSNGYLFYNLGNAYFLQGRLGDAILWYERAKRYLPRFDDLAVNLAYAQNQIVDEIATPPEPNGTLGLFLWIYDSFNPNELAWIALAAHWLWVLGLGGMLWFNQSNFKGWIRVPCWAGGLAFIIFVSCVAVKIYSFETIEEGVITSSAVEIKTAPGKDFSTAFSLHEGAKVRMVQRQDGWVQIRLPNDAAFTGWMPDEGVRSIGL